MHDIPDDIMKAAREAEPKLDLSDFRERVTMRSELLKADGEANRAIEERHNAFWRECVVGGLAAGLYSSDAADRADRALTEAVQRGRV